MRFRRMLVVAVVLLAVATAGAMTWGALALRDVSSQQLRVSRDFTADLQTAQRLRSLAQDLAALGHALPAPAVFDPWLTHWSDRFRTILAELRARNIDAVARSHVLDLEIAAEQCVRACVESGDSALSHRSHGRLENAISRFVDREAAVFEQASERVYRRSSRYQNALVMLTVLIVAAGLTLATVAIRRIDHWFRREQAAAAIAQREAAARQEVLAIVSHDLRTPLSTIMLGSALLADSIPDTGEPRGPRRQVQVIRNAADRMTHLIDEVLDTARIEAGTIKLHKTACDVGELLDKAMEMFQLRAAAKSIAVRREPLGEPLQVDADPERLLQILSNLMSNALKFTPPGGEIIASAEPQPDHVVFTIRDTGPGIPPDQREHLFDRYWQAAGSEQRGTLGLGLFICKSLVEAHGGKIWLEVPDGGSQFRFTIPR